MPATLPLELHHRIIDLGLSCHDWSHRDWLQEFLAECDCGFLARCCLVSKGWLDHAQKLLYLNVHLTPAVECALVGNPSLASLTKHLWVADVRTGRAAISAFERIFTTLLDFPAVISLSVSDDDVRVKAILPSTPKCFGSSTSLARLVVTGSTNTRLASLMAVLSNLITVRSILLCCGRYSELETHRPVQATCKLQELFLQSILSFDSRKLDDLLGSSKDSLKIVTLAYCSRHIVGILEYIRCTAVSHINLAFSLDEIRSEVPDLVMLSQVLVGLTSLKEVSHTQPASGKKDTV